MPFIWAMSPLLRRRMALQRSLRVYIITRCARLQSAGHDMAPYPSCLHRYINAVFKIQNQPWASCKSTTLQRSGWRVAPLKARVGQAPRYARRGPLSSGEQGIRLPGPARNRNGTPHTALRQGRPRSHVGVHARLGLRRARKLAAALCGAGHAHESVCIFAASPHFTAPTSELGHSLLLPAES